MTSGRERFVAEIRAGARLEGVSYEDEQPAPDRRKGRAERLEEWVTMAAFLVMFVTLVIGVFWRYVLDDPLIWTVNLGTVAFIWVVMIGSGLPNWDESHIHFDLVYDRLSPAAQRWARVVGNVLIIVPFTVAIPGTIAYLQFVSSDSVTGLPFSFGAAYACVLVFLAATVAHRGRLLLNDVRDMSHDGPRQEPA